VSHADQTLALPDTAPLCAELEYEALSIHRRDRRRGTLITLAGEMDLDSAPLLLQAVEDCLRSGIRSIDIDLTGVTFCDVSGLNAFLDATWRTTAAGGRMRLENLCPMLTRLLALTETHLFLAVRIDEGVRAVVPRARIGGRPGDQ
jgi:anti-sigma B factor antagonist